MRIINDVPNDSYFATCVFTVLLFLTPMFNERKLLCRKWMAYDTTIFTEYKLLIINLQNTGNKLIFNDI